jgi:transglutaminase-like putative cysteine protease
MKWYLPFWFLFSVLFHHSSAQINTKIPDWITPIEVNKHSSINTGEVTDGYYYVLFDEQYNTISRQHYFHYAKRIVNEEALTSVSQIEFSYDPSYEKAFLHFVKIIRGPVVIDKTMGLNYKLLNEESERNMGLLNGRKTFYTNLTDIRKGDIVEYSFSVHGENPIMAKYFNYTFMLGYSDAIDRIHYRILFPKDTKANILNRNISIKPLIKQTSFNEYVWQVNKPAVVKPESAAPAWYDPYPSVQISNLKDWNEVKEHCKSIFALPAYDHSELKVIFDSITGCTSDPSARISAIVDFVQKHIRYSGDEGGIYSNVPRAPDVVLKNRFGDCKEKSVLLNELLKLMHVDAHPVLIHTILRKKTPEQVPGIRCFNHCISSFTYGGEIYFIDPTISYQTGSFKKRILPPYGKGMILDDTKNAFVTITVDLSSQTTVLEEFENTDSADTKLKVTSTFKGVDADEIRYYFLTASRNEIQTSYKKFYSRYCDRIEVMDTICFTDNSESNEVTTIEHYLLKNFWSINDSLHTPIIKKDFLPYALNSRLVYGDEPKRKDPLHLDYPLNFTQLITIKHRNGWNIQSDLKEENNKFFHYSYSKKVEGNTLKLLYNYRNLTDLVETKDYERYRSKMEFVNRNIVMSVEETPFKKENAGFNWLLLLTITFGIVLAGIAIWHLNKLSFKSHFENKYSSIGGWLLLIGFGLLITPLNYLVTIYNEWNEQKDINYFYYYFHEESDFFSPLKGYYTLFINFFDVLMLVYAVFLVSIFFQKRTCFRFHYVTFKLITTFFLIVHVIVIYQGYSEENSTMDERRELTRQTASLVGTFIASCIWVPYIWFSERSRHTFTHENGDEEL